MVRDFSLLNTSLIIGFYLGIGKFHKQCESKEG